jgi:hypothetical protein
MSTQNIFSLLDTWNAAGTTFTGVGLNVTDTASAAASLLMDLQVGGVSQFRVSKGGRITAQTLTIGLGGQTSVATNTAFGVSALNSASLTGVENTAIGNFAGAGVTTGNNSTAVGHFAALVLTTGGSNTAIGAHALVAATTGGSNTAIGSQALSALTTGFSNVAVGRQAGETITTGSTNIAIGYDIDVDSATASNQINIGDRYFHDRIRLLERATDPAKPAEGNMIVWMSDGTGLGDDGDVIISSTAGGVTNYAILFDHSAGTLWP